jgi:hypothetical protein
VLAEKEKKSNNLKIARILLFICAITAVILLFYSSTVLNIISNDVYLIGGFGVVVASAIINYALIRVYGKRPPKQFPNNTDSQ